MEKEVNNSFKTRCLQTIKKSSSETLVKNRYQLKNHLRKKQQKHVGVSSKRTMEYNHSAEWIKREKQKQNAGHGRI